MTTRKVICDYCKNDAKLIDSAVIYGKSYGIIWNCDPCKAYVGVHRKSKDYAPLGRLANKELRIWKMKAHGLFDPLWQSGKMTRKQAYLYLCEVMGLDESKAHIGMFDVDECKRLVAALSE